MTKPNADATMTTNAAGGEQPSPAAAQVGRKRRRRRRESHRDVCAQTPPPQIAGGIPGGREANGLSSAWGDDLSRSDLQLVRQAIRNGWPVKQSTRNAIVAMVTRAALTGRTHRLIQLAQMTLVEMDEANRRDRERVEAAGSSEA